MQDETEEQHIDSERPMEETLYKLQLRFKKDTILELALTARDSFFELRSYITDLPNLYFQPSFHFQFEGKKINEYNELEKEIDLEAVAQPLKIDILPDEYDYKSARELVRKINEFFRNPKKIISQIRCKISMNLVDSKANFIKLDFGNLLSKTSSGHKEKKKTLEVSRIFSEGIAAYPALAKDPWHRFSNSEKNLFIESLEFSGWNPPPSKRRMVGDFFYLKLVTIEKETHFITAFSRGFYLNKLSDQGFDPSAISDPYFSLLDLIASVSPHFRKLFESNLFESVNVDLVDIPVSAPSEPVRWLRSLDEIDDHIFDQFRSGEELYNNFVHGNSSFRDWNEEIQNYKKMEARDFYDQLNKAKIHERIQKDFLEAALEGGKAIVEGKLSSMNVSSSQNDKCYIYNNIFYTFCSEDHLSMSQPRGDDAPSTVVTASMDMENMKLLEDMDGKDIHTVQTALIRYKGYCVTAQSLIQGILYYDEKTWTKYGSVDEGKSIADDPEFSEVIGKISKIFHVKDDLKYIDHEGKEHSMKSPIDIKGILGGDNRKYVLDLFRMCPRDLNWEGPENDAVVFRPKLVESYLYQLKLEITEEVRQKYITQINELKQKQQTLVADFSKAQEKEGTDDIKNDADTDATVAVTKSLQQTKEELQQIHVKMYKEIDEEVKKQNISEIRFDTSLYSGLESHYADKTQEEEERTKLRKLADFAKNKVVRNFIDEWIRMHKVIPIDTTSLISAMHNFGLSSRYLGFVLQSLEPQAQMKNILLVQRSILVKSMSHLLNHVLRTVPSIQIPDTISHLLNCAVGGKLVSDFLDQKVKNLSKPQEKISTDVTETLVDNKKKKKKKQGKVQQVRCDIDPNPYMLYTPTELFADVNAIAEKRYKQRFSETRFTDFLFSSNPIDRVSFLREICLSIGLCLGYRDFNFSDQNNSNSLELPVKPSDIGDFVPYIKKNDSEFIQAKVNYSLGTQYVASGKYEAAIEIYNSTLQALLNIYGPCNPSVLEFASTLAALYATVNKKDNAIAIQKSVVKLTEKTYGVDNMMTVNAYMELARYYYEIENLDRTQTCLVSALYLADLVGGAFNMESIKLLEEIQNLYTEKKDFKSSLICAEELHQRYLRMYDKNSLQMAWIYYHLSSLHLMNQNQKEATNFAQLRLAIISKHFKTSYPAKVEDAKKFVNYINSGAKTQTPQAEQDASETLLLREKLHQNRMLNKRK